MSTRYTKNAPSFTIGVEEEYWLIDKQNKSLILDFPQELHQELKNKLGEQVCYEYMRSQVEIGTKPHQNLHDTKQELIKYRRCIKEVAAEFGISLIASSTHPFSDWKSQKPTPKQRYDQISEDLQSMANRMLICGMHVHVAIEDPDVRIDLMNQLSYFLPHILALTTSSPFWIRRVTGLLCYRLAIFDTLPRTGLPERFNTYHEFMRFVQTMVECNAIPDKSKIWWDLRPNSKYPTLEVRICDVCTDVEDAIAVAALVRCLLRSLYRLKVDNRKWRGYPIALINENRWRAMRYGFLENPRLRLIDCGTRQSSDYYAQMSSELLEIIAKDVEFFGCHDEIQHLQTILQRGTSANQQLQIYQQALSDNFSQKQALVEVVKWLEDTTVKQ